MNILYDLSSNQPQGSMKINGGGEYSYMIFEYLYENKSVDDCFTVIFNGNNPDSLKAISHCKKNNIETIYYKSIEDFNHMMKVGEYDLLVLPVCYHVYSKLIIPDRTRVVSVVHDLCDVYYYNGEIVKYGRYPKVEYKTPLRKLKARLLSAKIRKKVVDNHKAIFNLSNNQTVITVSNYSLATFYKYLDIASEKEIHVLYPPENRKPVYLNEEIENGILNKYSIKKKKYFFLCAGCRWAKNNAIALFVLDKMFSDKKYDYFLSGFKVVITGVDQVYREYYCRHIVNIDRFVFEDYIDDVSIETLFKNAHLFIFPSVLEGFGQPPIEAMKYQTLVACSTAMCIPEVCGDAAIYFDPLCEASIELAIIQSYNDSYTANLREKEIRRVNELGTRRFEDLRKFINVIYK